MGLENNIRYFYNLEDKLLKYFPDGSVVKTEKGLVSIFQEGLETYLILLDSGEISTRSGQYVKLGLTPENLSELLRSWFSDNRFFYEWYVRVFASNWQLLSQRDRLAPKAHIFC